MRPKGSDKRTAARAAGIFLAAWAAAFALALPAPGDALGDVVTATPKDFRAKILSLAPGDMLELEAGEYPGPLRLTDMHGQPGRN